MTNYSHITKCLCCSGPVQSCLDLGHQPLANNYHDNPLSNQEQYPLQLNVCDYCWHTQLSVAVRPEILFSNYLYATGTNDTIVEYSEWFADFVLDYVNTGNRKPNEEYHVLDVASNDGTQLNAFLNRDCKTFGIDPAENLCAEAKLKGHEIINGFFPDVLGTKKSRDLKQADFVIAQNVIAHTRYPFEFLNGIKDCMCIGGLAFVQTSQSQMYQRNEFDTIYHEHISFFSVNSMKYLAKRAGLKLLDVRISPIHGDSYIFVLCREDDYSFLLEKEDLTSFFKVDFGSVERHIVKEEEEGRMSKEFYETFAFNASGIIDELSLMITDLRQGGYKVVGYGAAAKGMTVLNSRNIQLDWIVDDAPLKQGLYTPGTNIHIKDRSSLDIDDDIILIPLAWNFFDEIKEKVEAIRKGRQTKYIRYFPEVEIG